MQFKARQVYKSTFATQNRDTNGGYLFPSLLNTLCPQVRGHSLLLRSVASPGGLAACSLLPHKLSRGTVNCSEPAKGLWMHNYLTYFRLRTEIFETELTSEGAVKLYVDQVLKQM